MSTLLTTVQEFSCSSLPSHLHRWINVPLPKTAVAGIFILVYLVARKGLDSGVRNMAKWSFSSAWKFFSQRYDFLNKHLAAVGDTICTIRLLHHRVTVLTGEEGRKAFFENKSMHFGEGYKALRRGGPRLGDINVTLTHRSLSQTVPFVLSSKRISEVLPPVLELVQAQMEVWDTKGLVDLFDIIPNLIFHMAVGLAGCRQMANDKDAISRLQADFEILETSSTPISMLLSWLPSKRKSERKSATYGLYNTISYYIGGRREASMESSDTIDFLLKEGWRTEDIVGFVLGTIYASTSSTPIIACWVLIFLSSHKDWSSKVLAEVRTLLATHCDLFSSDLLHERLAAIPIAAWESDMPVTDSVLRETMRISLNNTAFRRNILEDVHMNKGTLPQGDLVVYPTWDAHLNPDIYSQPHEFDPERFGPGRKEDKTQALAYLVWGAGRHSCAGMQLAKLQMKVFVVFFLLAFEYEIVDEAGNPLAEVPRPNYNDIKLARPAGDQCLIKFRRVML